MDSCAAIKAAAAPPISAGWHLCWLTCSAQAVEPSASLAHFHPSDKTVMKTLSTWQQVAINMERLGLIDGIKEKQHLCFLSRKRQATCDVLNFKIIPASLFWSLCTRNWHLCQLFFMQGFYWPSVQVVNLHAVWAGQLHEKILRKKNNNNGKHTWRGFKLLSLFSKVIYQFEAKIFYREDAKHFSMQ